MEKNKIYITFMVLFTVSAIATVFVLTSNIEPRTADFKVTFKSTGGWTAKVMVNENEDDVFDYVSVTDVHKSYLFEDCESVFVAATKPFEFGQLTVTVERRSSDGGVFVVVEEKITFKSYEYEVLRLYADVDSLSYSEKR